MLKAGAQFDDVSGVATSKPNAVMTNMDMWTDPDTPAINGITVTGPQMLAKSNFKALDATKSHRRYYNNAPIAAIQNIDWADTKDSTPFVDQGNKTAANIYYRFSTSGHDLDNPVPITGALGQFDVTYYCRFRGLKSDTETI